jgi:hypothetical protein
MIIKSLLDSTRRRVKQRLDPSTSTPLYEEPVTDIRNFLWPVNN